MGVIAVRSATLDDMTYIDHLQRKNAEELSFYPLSVLERETKNQRVVLALVNDEPAGYLYHGSHASNVLRIHQACIQYDLRGYMYGAALVQWLIDIGRVSGALEISLRCGSDIAANGFWRAMGFDCVAVKPGGARRMRDLNVWRYPLEGALFAISQTPSERKQSASAWAKARRAGLSLDSPFLRGAALIEYRKSVEEVSD
jgi:hypothetical protein